MLQKITTFLTVLLLSLSSAYAAQVTGSENLQPFPKKAPPPNATENAPAKVPALERARESAFDSVMNQALPMNQDQIAALHDRLDQTQRAAAALPNTPPKPVSSTLIVGLGPGTEPPVIRLAAGFVTSMVFVDATGAPWPIQSYVIGDPKAFEIKWDKKSHNLAVQALSPYKYGNMQVNLFGSPTPVMIALTTGQAEVDYRVDLRIQGIGPNPNTDLLGDGMPEKPDNLLLNLLNGLAPKGAKQMRVSGPYSKVWAYKGKMYLRTNYKLLSPGWTAAMSSADGTHAYELERTPLLLVSAHGKVVSLQVTGFE